MVSIRILMVTWNRCRVSSEFSLEMIGRNILSGLCYKCNLDPAKLYELETWDSKPFLSTRRKYFDLLFFHTVLHGILPSPEQFQFLLHERTWEAFPLLSHLITPYYLLLDVLLWPFSDIKNCILFKTMQVSNKKLKNFLP